jgi:hypothetical protein
MPFYNLMALEEAAEALGASILAGEDNIPLCDDGRDNG